MQYVEAPHYKEKTGQFSIFLGGGITNCPDWQSTIVENLKDLNVTIYNPRRAEFNMSDHNQTVTQIGWEHFYLREADVNVFWFCRETLCPITLFELGSALERFKGNYKQLFIGYDKEYVRKKDVAWQAKHMGYRPDCSNTLEGLIKKIRRFYHATQK